MPPENKKSDSDVLRKAEIADYLAAQSKPNGNGHVWKGFFRSNLFTGLVLWLLTQICIIVGTFVAFNYRLTDIAKWSGGVDAILKRMDEQGTIRSHYELEQDGKQIAGLEVRMKAVEGDTSHLDVLEAEHRRLTTDVEKLKNEKK